MNWSREHRYEAIHMIWNMEGMQTVSLQKVKQLITGLKVLCENASLRRRTTILYIELHWSVGSWKIKRIRHVEGEKREGTLILTRKRLLLFAKRDQDSAEISCTPKNCIYKAPPPNKILPIGRGKTKDQFLFLLLIMVRLLAPSKCPIFDKNAIIAEVEVNVF